MTVNGEPLDPGELSGDTIEALLNHFKLSKNRVALEINGTVIKKADYDSVKLKESDIIEIIHFVGGGSESTF